MTRDVCWLGNNCNGIDCDKFCLRYFKLNYLYDNALISEIQRKHLKLLLDSNMQDKNAFLSLKQIEDNILNFVTDGGNLYIHSRIAGNGKTSWSLRLVQTYFNKIWPSCSLACKALFINVPRYLLALKDNISVKSDYISHIKENILNTDLVIWDDIGTKCATTYEHEALYSAINARMDIGKANIFTSNLNDIELHEALGDRLASRVANKSINIELYGSDKRGLKNE